MGLNLGPIPIRLLLAVTFIWAGAGKFFAQDEYVGERAYALYEMGVIPGPAGTVTDPAPEEPADEGGDEGAGEADPAGGTGGQIGLAYSGTVRLVAQDEAATTYTVADFDEPIEKMRVLGVAVQLYQGAHPGFEEGTSTPRRVIVPQWAAGSKTPVYLAYAVGVTELIGGALVLVGLLTRLSALGLVGTMAGAMWLTIFGPAMQSGNALLGFLPNQSVFPIEDWSVPLWLFALIAASASLVLTGAGSLSLHGFLFGSRAEDDEDDYEEE